MSPLTPEQRARQTIDTALTAAGWQVQDEEDMGSAAGQGVAVRGFPRRGTSERRPMAPGHGRADYLLFVDGRPVGALEAKKKGHTLIGVEGQAKKYSEGAAQPLPGASQAAAFLCESTRLETRFTNLFGPHLARAAYS